MLNQMLLYLSLGTALCLAANTCVIAQDLDGDSTKADETTLLKRKSIIVVRKRVEEVDTKGIAIGGFVFSPAISLTEYYDDNIYATDVNELDDFVTVITPTFDLKSKWDKHAFDLNAGLEVSRYADYTNENTENYWLNISGRYDFTPGQNMFGGIAFMQDHEDRASPDAEAGDFPTRFDEYNANFGYVGAFGNHYFKLALSGTVLDFMDVTSSSGLIDNDDRDRTEQAIGLRYLYKYSPASAMYIEGVLDQRDYDQVPDNDGNDRNSTGYRYAAGFEWVTVASVTKLFVGGLGRDYDSSAFEDPSETDFGLSYIWKFTSSSSLTLQVKRSIDETTFNNSPGYLMTDGSVTLNFAVGAGKSLSFDVIAATADYYGIQRQDDYFNYAVGYAQQIVDNLTFGVDLHRSERDSDISGEDYTINQVFLRIKGVI